MNAQTGLHRYSSHHHRIKHFQKSLLRSRCYFKCFTHIKSFSPQDPHGLASEQAPGAQRSWIICLQITQATTSTRESNRGSLAGALTTSCTPGQRGSPLYWCNNRSMGKRKDSLRRCRKAGAKLIKHLSRGYSREGQPGRVSLSLWRTKGASWLVSFPLPGFRTLHCWCLANVAVLLFRCFNKDLK